MITRNYYWLSKLRATLKPRMIVHDSGMLKKDTSRRHPTAPQQAVPFECPRELAGLHVLVVDDEEDARDLLATVLRSCGSEVTTASSAVEAIAVVKTLKPELLVSDIEMPVEDGYSLITEIRALKPRTADRHRPTHSPHMSAWKTACVRSPPVIKCMWQSRSSLPNSSS